MVKERGLGAIVFQYYYGSRVGLQLDGWWSSSRPLQDAMVRPGKKLPGHMGHKKRTVPSYV